MDLAPGKWDQSAAGHVDEGESYIEAALRETKEELGLDIPKDRFQYLFTLKTENTTNNGVYINKEFKDVYLVEMDLNISELNLQESEVSDVKFILVKELERMVKEGDIRLASQNEEYQKLFEYLKEKLNQK